MPECRRQSITPERFSTNFHTFCFAATRIGACAFSCNRLKRVVVLRPGAAFDEHVFSDNGVWTSGELVMAGYEGSNAEVYADRNRHRFEPIGRLSAATG